MPKFTVIAEIGASTSADVEADSPDDAINKAQLRRSLCHQCASHIDIGDPYGFVVLDEAGEEVLNEAEDREAAHETGRGLGEVADAAGLRPVVLSSWEAGWERPSVEQMTDLLLGLGPVVDATLAALWSLRTLPPRPKRDGLAPFVSFAHVDGDPAACPCNECRAELFHANRCLECDGSGLRPDFDAAPPVPKEPTP